MIWVGCIVVFVCLLCVLIVWCVCRFAGLGGLMGGIGLYAVTFVVWLLLRCVDFSMHVLVLGWVCLFSLFVIKLCYCGVSCSLCVLLVCVVVLACSHRCYFYLVLECCIIALGWVV